jgi:hypothetical protein
MELGVIGTLFGVAFGFIVVMLLLSLVVTGVTQAFQAVVKLRMRATRAVLMRKLEDRAERDRLAKRPTDDARAKLQEAQELFSGNEERRVIYPKELKALGFKTRRQQQQFNAAVTEQFTGWMRWTTFAASLLVAFVFQMSATALIKDLSTDKELRAKLEEAGDRLAQKEAAIRTATASFPELSEKAIEKLAKEKPDIAGRLEEFSGRAVDEADATAELGLILEGHAERDPAVKRFSEIITESLGDSSKAATALSNFAKSELALIDITFWRGGWSFYGDFANLFGVLLTGILLSFGAPFWYERLRDLQVLRDALYSRPDRKKEVPAQDVRNGTPSPKAKRPPNGGGATGAAAPP